MGFALVSTISTVEPYRLEAMVEPIRAQDVQATFCATLVDEWINQGVRSVVIAPGSRSTPLAVALAARIELSVQVVHDERVAGFVALGLGLSGVPSILLCTSGTAAANFFPAVVEAGLSDVPMIVVTADRPEELRGVGAPQTIDQVELYGSHVRWYHDPGVADAAERGQWRTLAAETMQRAQAGPIQLNLPFREPLLGVPGVLPEEFAGDAAVRDGAEERGEHTALVCEPLSAITEPHGLILAGGRSGVDAASVATLHALTGWPILADPISGMRHLDGVVTTSESMLRSAPFADCHLPDVVIRVGRPSTSKTLAQWIDHAVAGGAQLVQVGGPGLIDPGCNVDAVATLDAVIAAVEGTTPDSEWLDDWTTADRAADAAVLAALSETDELSEPLVARTVADHLPAGVDLVVSSSMPIRDHEWFGGRRATAHANRGANGIDGVMSTARGIAAMGKSTAVLIGDLAFVHDSNALVGLVANGIDLRVVVVDNDGGGIFSFLPQASTLARDRFEQLFGTPLGTDVAALATAHGIDVCTVATADELIDQLAKPGPWVVRIESTRDRNVEVHADLHAAVAAAIS
ncbi:2-succinyl-5-enolpyruvyl-6-hydroxy-3-cyclohexene-1-carboxylic-acid synthase [Ilumatobacter sp.]|uniref:2-succinyl-5-enolpyruvyl-6-hydroxy-3- cyclohexene-1-carboxylic-acid synthase n=1 Tax=Ilumatobacter sp. TaxID=1967498 RepID=UPI00374FEBFC